MVETIFVKELGALYINRGVWTLFCRTGEKQIEVFERRGSDQKESYDHQSRGLCDGKRLWERGRLDSACGVSSHVDSAVQLCPGQGPRQQASFTVLSALGKRFCSLIYSLGSFLSKVNPHSVRGLSISSPEGRIVQWEKSSPNCGLLTEEY